MWHEPLVMHSLMKVARTTPKPSENLQRSRPKARQRHCNIPESTDDTSSVIPGAENGKVVFCLKGEQCEAADSDGGQHKGLKDRNLRHIAHWGILSKKLS